MWCRVAHLSCRERESLFGACSTAAAILFRSVPSRLPCGWLQAGKEERNRGGGTPTAGGGRINSVRPAGRRKRKTAASNSIPWRWPCCCWASSSASSPWPSPRGQRSSGPSATSRAARRGRRGTQRQSPYTRRRRSSSDRVFCGC